MILLSYKALSAPLVDANLTCVSSRGGDTALRISREASRDRQLRLGGWDPYRATWADIEWPNEDLALRVMLGSIRDVKPGPNGSRGSSRLIDRNSESKAMKNRRRSWITRESSVWNRRA